MKRTDGFDARRLRPREQRSWGARLGAMLGMLLSLLGVLLAGVGGASLFGSHAAFASLALEYEEAVTFLVLGLVLLVIGLLVRRYARRRLRGPGGLSLSPGLKKKR